MSSSWSATLSSSSDGNSGGCGGGGSGRAASSMLRWGCAKFTWSVTSLQRLSTLILYYPKVELLAIWMCMCLVSASLARSFLLDQLTQTRPVRSRRNGCCGSCVPALRPHFHVSPARFGSTKEFFVWCRRWCQQATSQVLSNPTEDERMNRTRITAGPAVPSLQ